MKDSDTLLIFDCFGVIITPIVKKWFLKHSLHDFTIEDFLSLCKKGDIGEYSYEDVIKVLSDHSNMTVEEIDNMMMKNAKPMKIVKHLDELRKNHCVMLLSNATKIIDRIFEIYHLSDKFDYKIISCEIKMIKPNEDIYRYAINLPNKEFKNIYFFDDNIENVKAAKKIGIKAYRYKNYSEFKKIMKRAI